MNVIICGVVKNAAARLKRNIEIAFQLGSECSSFKIVIYENNSSDATKSILKEYTTHPLFKIISEDISDEAIKRTSDIWAYTAVTGSDHPCRIEQIANARNRLIDELNQDQHAYAPFDYVVMIDFDAQHFLIEGILHSLQLVKENRKRVIYANSPKYYDYYALRSAHSAFNLFGPELMGEQFWQTMTNHRLQLAPSDNLLPVYSAFNGIGVYDKNAFVSQRFAAVLTPIVKQVYEKLALQHSAIYEQHKPVLQSECQRFKGGEQGDLFYWKNNSGYGKPVVCEHVAFNFALLNDGYDILINPKMLYWWA